jgi:hypothetical protein
MKASIKTSGFLALLGLLCFGLLGAVPRTQETQGKQESKQPPVHLIPSLEGVDLFHAYCSPCHGADGTGNGPVAPALTSKVPDLTTLAKQHGGIFPRAHVRKTISGQDAVVAHGSREMPIWGEIFHQVEQDRDYGNVRLTNVTKYIESIQVK